MYKTRVYWSVQLLWMSNLWSRNYFPISLYSVFFYDMNATLINVIMMVYYMFISMYSVIIYLSIFRFRQMYIDTMTMVPERYGIYNINKKQKMKEIKMFYIITSNWGHPVNS
jgi:hypothetical protein